MLSFIDNIRSSDQAEGGGAFSTSKTAIIQIPDMQRMSAPVDIHMFFMENKMS